MKKFWRKIKNLKGYHWLLIVSLIVGGMTAAFGPYLIHTLPNGSAMEVIAIVLTSVFGGLSALGGIFGFAITIAEASYY